MEGEVAGRKCRRLLVALGRVRIERVTVPVYLYDDAIEKTTDDMAIERAITEAKDMEWETTGTLVGDRAVVANEAWPPAFNAPRV